MFAEEGTEMFQCPACNTLVDVTARTCPGCGAMFVEPEEAPEAKAPERPPAPAPKPAPAEIRPAPAPPKREVPTEKPKAEPKLEEKKGLFGAIFKRGKKEEELEPEPPRPPVREAAPPAAPAPPPRPKEAPPPVKHEVPAEPVAKDKGKDLARMVAEMKPLLALARDREVDIGESKQLIDDAAMAGRERQLDRAIDLVQKSKNTLMAKIDASLGQEIAKLNEETKVARDFGGDTSRALTYVQEIARARSSGDVEAAYVYVDKARNELLPITGRYNDLRTKLTSMKQLVADCELLIVDSKEARSQLVEANRAFDAKDFDKTEVLIKSAREKLYKNIPPRMNEEMKKARDELVNAKMKNINISPMITVLKSATSSMKSGDYQQALKDMREFRELMKRAG
jgi:cellobiose-specific phosphotransferase system component IIA